MNKLKVLIIDGGARGHSMAQKFDESPLIDKDHRYIVPGNAGAALDGWQLLPKAINWNCDALATFADKYRIDFTFVGQEAPLVDDIVKKWPRARPIWGPNLENAMLEGDKAVAKAVMEKLNVPTARPWQIFIGPYMAHDWADRQPEDVGWAVKYRFLAAGRGVIITHNRAETHAAIDQIEEDYGPYAQTLIEPLLPGREISLICLRSGAEGFILPPAQDYKRVGNADTGPNCGGMGCYAPAPWFTPAMQESAMEQIVRPMVCKVNYQGTFYAGLMIDAKGQPSVIEINCRGGDPETVAQNALIEGDLLEYMYLHLTTRFPGATRISVSNKKAVVVVLCTGGYPTSEHYNRGALITGLDEAAKIEGVKIIHAGTALENDKIYAVGGRVIDILATGDTFTQAIDRAYEAAGLVFWKGMFYRRDIAACVREKK